MSTPRSASELRKAALDAGWRGDPLAEEILGKLEELDAAGNAVAQGGAGGAPAKGPLVVAIVVAVLGVIGAAVAGTAYFAAVKGSQETLAARDAEAVALKAALANKDDELSALRAQNLASLESAAKAMQSVVAAAEATAKSNATAADANQAAVRSYMTEFHDLLMEARRLKDERAPTPGGGGAQQAP